VVKGDDLSALTVEKGGKPANFPVDAKGIGLWRGRSVPYGECTVENPSSLGFDWFLKLNEMIDDIRR